MSDKSSQPSAEVPSGNNTINLVPTSPLPTPQQQLADLSGAVSIELKNKASEDFQHLVLKTGHDYRGGDSQDSETLKNPVHEHLMGKMNEKFFVIDSKWPLKYQKEWMDAVSTSMAEKVNNYGMRGAMDRHHVDEDIKAVEKEVGTFEKWFETTHNQDFVEAKTAHQALETKRQELAAKKSAAKATCEAWKTDKDPLKVLTDKAEEWLKDLDGLNEKGLMERAAAITALAGLAEKLKTGRDEALAAAGKTALTGLKARYEALAKAFAETTDTEDLNKKNNDELASLADLGGKITVTHNKVSALDTKLTALPTAIIPKTLRANVDALKEAAQNSDGSNINTNEGQIAVLTGQIDALAPLKEIAVDGSIPEAEREKVLAPFRDKEATVATVGIAVQQFAQLKKTAALAEAEDAPFIDKAFASIDDMEDGPLKTGLGKLVTKIAEALASISNGAMGGIAAFLGFKASNFISNKLLAKFGDTKAEARIKVETEFNKFGLPRDLAAKLDGMKTKDVVTEIITKPNADPAVQSNLAFLAREIEKRGGANNEAPLYEFIGSSLWVSINYKEAPVAKAPASAPAETPVGAPAEGEKVKPEAPQGAPKAPEVSLSPEKERVKQLDAEIGRVFATPQSPSTGIDFKLPYIKENTIATATLTFNGKIITVGDKKYEIQLPVGATAIQTINVVSGGNYDNGKAVLTVGTLGGSVIREIPLKKLFDTFEALRTTNQNAIEIPLADNNKLTFQSIS